MIKPRIPFNLLILAVLQRIIRWSRSFHVSGLTYRNLGPLSAASFLAAFIVFRWGYVNCWSDSHEFLAYAESFFKPAERIAWYYRDPAYPFLIWLSGFTFTHSLFVLFLFQTIFAGLVPILICLTVACVSPTAGLVAGWLSLISLIPFIFQLELFNDQIHLFLLVLCAFTAIRCYYTGHTRYLYGTAISFGLLFACRPTFFVLAPLPIFIAALWFQNKRPVGRAILHITAAALILSIMTGINLWLRAAPYVHEAQSANDADLINDKVLTGTPLFGHLRKHDSGFSPVTNYSGEQLFSQLYLHGGKLPGTFSPEDGPYTRRFLDVMRIYIQNSDYINGTPKSSFIDFAQRFIQPKTATVITPAQTLEAYLHHPIYQLATLCYFFDWYGNRANALVRGMYIEQVTRHPEILLSMLHSGFSEVMLSTYAKYHFGDKYFSYPFLPTIFFEPFDKQYGCQNTNVSDFIDWTQRGIRKLRHFNRKYRHYYIAFTRICNFAAVAGLPLYLCWLFSRNADRRRESIVYFILFTLYWVPNFIMMFVVLIIFRYHASAELLPVMMAVMVLRQAAKFIFSALPNTDSPQVISAGQGHA